MEVTDCKLLFGETCSKSRRKKDLAIARGGEWAWKVSEERGVSVEEI